jgi:pyridinium-3,5-biscarboxylic acid mononucleotide sulfurtransferase
LLPYKLKKLRTLLKDMRSVLVAYSGGVDSTFLLKVAHDVLGSRVLAVTAVSPSYPPEELAYACQTAKKFKARHEVIRTGELEDKRFSANPPERCYFCKKELFRRLTGLARKKRLNFVVDATNVSDAKDIRPGNKAKRELGIRSPLVESGFTKKEIRLISKRLKLETWDKPSLACLASRIPYGTKITGPLLKRVDKAECFVRSLGVRQVRVRHYGPLCRIEVMKKDIPRLIERRETIVRRMNSLGYDYVTVDLKGYRTGSMNERTVR